jgi:hypothetical protein
MRNREIRSMGREREVTEEGGYAERDELITEKRTETKDGEDG